MTALRGSPEFRDAVVEAAALLGIAERQIEKDCWVTATLRELAEDLLDELTSVVGEVCGSVGIVDPRTEGSPARMLFAYPELPNTPNGTWDASPDRHRSRRVRSPAMTDTAG
jgi:hypothetical protein